MIDLGTAPIGTTLPPTTLHVDEIGLLVHLLDLDSLPVVLDAGPRADSIAAREAVFRDAHDRLVAAGLLDGITVHPDLAGRLRVLARPRREVAVRRFGSGVVHRACLARGDDGSVLALRGGDTVTIRHLDHDPVGALARALGTVDALPFGAVNSPTADLCGALDRIGDPQSAAAHLIAIGVPAAPAAVVGPALADCPDIAEIVGLVHEHGRPPTAHGPVTVFDTRAGRIVGTTSVAADGVRWTSLGPGTPGRLRQALLDLLDGTG